MLRIGLSLAGAATATVEREPRTSWKLRQTHAVNDLTWPDLTCLSMDVRDCIRYKICQNTSYICAVVANILNAGALELNYETDALLLFLLPTHPCALLKYQQSHRGYFLYSPCTFVSVQQSLKPKLPRRCSGSPQHGTVFNSVWNWDCVSGVIFKYWVSVSLCRMTIYPTIPHYQPMIILQIRMRTRDARYQMIIGRFADNLYRPISTLVSADCRLHNW